jgi:N-methylhydantoinase B
VYEFLDDADAVVYTEQSREEHAPAGVHGGLPGRPANVRLERADGSAVEIRKDRVAVRAGDRLVVTTGGGGGHGDPRRRDREAVRRDVEEGKISAEAAAAVYGL